MGQTAKSKLPWDNKVVTLLFVHGFHNMVEMFVNQRVVSHCPVL